jgi:hypothetical protein
VTRRSAALGAVAVAVFYGALFAIAPADRPVIMDDQAGYVAIGRWLTGVGELPQQLSPFYSWAYGTLFTVPYLFTDRIGVVYAYGIVVNCAAGAALFVLLARVLVRVVPDARRSVVLACAFSGAAWSGVALQVGQTWPEVVLATLVAGWTLAVLRLCAGERRALLEVSILTVALFATHHRMAGLIPIGVVLLLRYRKAGTARSAAALAILAAGVGVTLLVDQLVQDALYPAGAIDPHLRYAWDAPDLVLRALLGELWYVAAATAGIVALAWATPFVRAPARRALIAGFGLTALLGAAQLAAAVEQGTPVRGDFFAYGRYAGPFVPVMLAVGVAALSASPRRRVVVVPLAAVVTVSGLQLAINGTRLGGFSNPLNITGLLGSGLFEVPLDVVGPSLLATLVAVGIAVAVPRIRSVVAAGAIAAVVALVGLGGAERIRRYLDGADNGGRNVVAFVDTLPSDATIYVDPTAEPVFELLQMLRPERRFVRRRVGREGPARWVVHDVRWTGARERRARRVSAAGDLQVVSCIGRACG